MRFNVTRDLRSIAAAIWLLLVVTAFASAQSASPMPSPAASLKPIASPTPEPTPIPNGRSKAIVALLNDARLAAPELTVWAILRVIEIKAIKDIDWRRELLEEAWRLSDDVKYPVRKERAYFGTGVVDTVSGYMTYAYEERLDGLSLKAAIIKAWLADDKTRAKQLLAQINGDLKLKPQTCEDAMIYVVGDIYATAATVAKDAFSKKEVDDGIRGLFLLPWIENLQSPSQIPPVIEMLRDLKSPPAERRLLINAFEKAIDRNFNDDVSFHRVFSNRAYETGTILRDAEERAGLIPIWRSMLAKNTLVLRRCLDSKPRQKDAKLPDEVRYFNPIFPEDQRFTDKDFESVEYSGKPQDKLYLDSPNYKQVSGLFRKAREARTRPETKDDKTAEIEWQIKITDVLEALDNWKATSEESEAEVFNQKCVFYRTMIPEIHDEDMRLFVYRSFMRYLVGSPMQKESFIEWMYHARWLAAREPYLFAMLSAEFPNPNLKVIARMRLGGY